MSDELIIFGTPFPAIENDNKNYVPIWNQKAVSSAGHKRLHGAFEGGFSAGYFNTVGSKEGWQPSNFISSRENRYKNSDAQVENYMDEEDKNALNCKDVVFIGMKNKISLKESNDINASLKFDPLLVISKYTKINETVTNLNRKGTEVFSGGAWDEEDEAIETYDVKEATLKKISSVLETLDGDTENFLDLAFCHSNKIFDEAKFSPPNIPNDFLPKKVRGFSEASFESIKSKIGNEFKFSHSLDNKFADIDEKTASAALKGFMPFSEDPIKQSRYIKYLRFCLDKTVASNISMSSIYLDEREKEEFIMSARIFKPNSSLISARFESSSLNGQPLIQLKPGLSKPEASKRQQSEIEPIYSDKLEKRPFGRINDPSSASGRTLHVWTPNSLLCKRFNVIPPENAISGNILVSKVVKPILADESVEKLVNTIMKDAKNKFKFEPDEKSSLLIDEKVTVLPSNDIFDEIFGQIDPASSKYKNKAVNYFGDD